MTGYYDRAGQPITSDQYGRLFEDEGYRIGIWHGEGGVTVSTVWLGIDLGGHRAPVIFETMIFGGTYDQAQARYCTEAAAADGHRRAVDALTAGRRPWFVTSEDAVQP